MKLKVGSIESRGVRRTAGGPRGGMVPRGMALACVLAGCLAAPARAQDPGLAPPSAPGFADRLSFQLFVGTTPHYSPAFDPRGYCGRDTHGLERGVAGSFALGSTFGLTLVQSWHLVRNGSRCPTPQFFPPDFDFTGEASFTGGDARLAGGHFAATRLRASARFPLSGPVSPRLHGGIGWVPSKSLFVRTAGAGLAIGGGPLRVVAEWEGWWYDVREVTVTGRFEEGQIVERTSTSRAVPTHTRFLRLGVEWAVGAARSEGP